MLDAHPGLAQTRLDTPGAWLREGVGGALDGFFEQPYLLWFVAEDPVRNGRLPSNVAEIARVIIARVQRAGGETLDDQLDYALRLVSWSWVARECGVQIELIDALLDAGASAGPPDAYARRLGEHCDAAIFNGNLAAAEHLLERGARATLATALCLGRWPAVDHLASTATPSEKRSAFVLAALNGKPESLRKLLDLGIDPTTVSSDTLSHATALHHAVSSGSLEAVRVLVEAGADSTRRDTIYGGTPLGWAEHCRQEQTLATSAQRYADIAEYLRSKGGHRAGSV